VAERAGLAVHPVAVDEHGLDVEALARTDARIVVLTPAHQSPTGVLLSAARRQALVAWAAERSGVVIEDDYDAEFRYDRRAVDSLQGLSPGHVVTIGSVSKTLAPTLRLGWVGCPASLTPEVVASKRFADYGSPGLDQLALATMLTSGRYDRHLRRMRGHYARRRQALVSALATHAPQVRLTGLAAGFHAVVHLPPDRDEQAVVAAAAERGVGLYAMAGHRARPGEHPPQLVLGFGDLTPDAIGRGIARVGDLLGG
jgi:GntR family transcriptional regulator/MocR family aminotransferase